MLTWFLICHRMVLPQRNDENRLPSNGFMFSSFILPAVFDRKGDDIVIAQHHLDTTTMKNALFIWPDFFDKFGKFFHRVAWSLECKSRFLNRHCALKGRELDSSKVEESVVIIFRGMKVLLSYFINPLDLKVEKVFVLWLKTCEKFGVCGLIMVSTAQISN